MKINIYFPFKESAWGGGNQFLKALKKFLQEKDFYTNNLSNADVILFDTYHWAKEVIMLKRKYPDKIFIHRIDGPISLYRGSSKILDKLIYKINELIADATIFQSNWSYEANKKLGLKTKKLEIVIGNAPNPQIFNRKNKLKFSKLRKTRIIANSWSSNWNKGFDVYRFLDENLDFKKFEMKFIGNSPINFKNIKTILPLPSKKLAKELSQADIYITASKNDPCSNSLIEAMHSGLLVLAYESGGHVELSGGRGIIYSNNKELLTLLYDIRNKYPEYIKKLGGNELPTMKEVGNSYLAHIEKVYESIKISNKISYINYLYLLFNFYYWRLSEKIEKHVGKRINTLGR